MNLATKISNELLNYLMDHGEITGEVKLLHEKFLAEKVQFIIDCHLINADVISQDLHPLTVQKLKNAYDRLKKQEEEP